MRKNEFESLEQFLSQYTGEWNPSEGHWLGLDFIYEIIISIQFITTQDNCSGLFLY